MCGALPPPNFVFHGHTSTDTAPVLHLQCLEHYNLSTARNRQPSESSNNNSNDSYLGITYRTSLVAGGSRGKRLARCLNCSSVTCTRTPRRGPHHHHQRKIEPPQNRRLKSERAAAAQQAQNVRLGINVSAALDEKDVSIFRGYCRERCTKTRRATARSQHQWTYKPSGSTTTQVRYSVKRESLASMGGSRDAGVDLLTIPIRF